MSICYWKASASLSKSKFYDKAAGSAVFLTCSQFSAKFQDRLLIKTSREFTQHDAPAYDESKKSRNERGQAILSQALARI